MSEWGKCVTHHICDCQRERVRRLEAVVKAARKFAYLEAATQDDEIVQALADLDRWEQARRQEAQP